MLLKLICIAALAALVSCQIDEIETTQENAQEENLKVKEIFETCKKPFVTENYDPAWEKNLGLNENSTFYIPLVSKSYLYRATQQLYSAVEFDKIKESQLTNSCLRMSKSLKENVMVWTTFGYKERNYTTLLSPMFNVPKTFQILQNLYSPVSFPGGRVAISLSDNKAFTVWVFCHDDGFGSFLVTSQERTIPSETLQIAKEHLKALGFKEELFTELNSDLDCDNYEIEDVPVAKNITLSPLIFNFLPPPPLAFRNGLGNGLFPFKK